MTFAVTQQAIAYAAVLGLDTLWERNRKHAPDTKIVGAGAGATLAVRELSSLLDGTAFCIRAFLHVQLYTHSCARSACMGVAARVMQEQDGDCTVGFVRRIALLSRDY